MNLNRMLAAAPLLKCTFVRERTGDPAWIRLFIRDSRGHSIGRLSFKDRVLTNSKFYKDKLTGPKIELDESDEVYARIEYLQICSKPLKDYDDIVSLARANVIEDFEAKKLARSLLPDKKRKGLQGKDLRREVRRLVRELAKEESQDGRDTDTVGTENH